MLDIALLCFDTVLLTTNGSPWVVYIMFLLQTLTMALWSNGARTDMAYDPFGVASKSPIDFRRQH